MCLTLSFGLCPWMLQTGGQAGTTPFMQLDATRVHV